MERYLRLATIIALFVGACGEEAQSLNHNITTPPVADSFIFPVKGKSVTDIRNNSRDPRQDGWYVTGFFGKFCLSKDCAGNEGFHPGEDWNMTCPNGRTDCDKGAPVYAAGDGVVKLAKRYVSEAKLIECEYRCDLGKAVVILHDLPSPEDVSKFTFPETTIPEKQRTVRQVETGYLHLETLAVEEGQIVKKGDLLGTIGNFNGPHLHFEVRWKTGNPIFSDYKATHQTLTDRGLLVPTAFISAHTETPFVFVPMEGWNPSVCKNEPTKSGIDSSLVCQKTTTAPLGATIWGAIQLDRIRKTTCVGAAFLKDGIYQYSSSPTCLIASDTNIRERSIIWTRTVPPSTGTWRIDYLTGETEYSLKKLAESTFTVNTFNVTPPPPPPRPIEQSFYTFAGIKKMCDRPLAKASWWEEFSCAGQSTAIAYGQGMYGLVKLHYLAPNVRFRFQDKIYHDGILLKTLDDAAWQDSGWYGLGEVYSFPNVTAATIGELPGPGTWTIRSFIAIDGKFTNWITDQQATIY